MRLTDLPVDRPVATLMLLVALTLSRTCLAADPEGQPLDSEGFIRHWLPSPEPMDKRLVQRYYRGQTNFISCARRVSSLHPKSAAGWRGPRSGDGLVQ